METVHYTVLNANIVLQENGISYIVLSTNIVPSVWRSASTFPPAATSFSGIRYLDLTILPTERRLAD